jgi:hypothetical protein
MLQHLGGEFSQSRARLEELAEKLFFVLALDLQG